MKIDEQFAKSVAGEIPITGWQNSTVDVVKLVHSFFWKMKLTPQLSFSHNTEPYKSLIDNTTTIIFPPIVSGNIIVKHGYKITIQSCL